MDMAKNYLARDLIEEYGMNRKTLWDWEMKGIIPRSFRNNYGWNVYTDKHVRAIEKRLEWLRKHGHKTKRGKKK